MPKKRSSSGDRNVRIADQIQRDLSELIAREVKDPRVGMVTIQSVELTPDYAHAKVFFTVLTGDSGQAQIALNHAAGHLHNLLFKRLRIHTVPTLHFIFDATTEKALELSHLIDMANATRAKDY
jgi:ribosome-binding factor A